MATWTLQQIRRKVRDVTGRFSSSEMTNEELDSRINQYYQLTFPAEVKLDAKLVDYKFITDAYQPTYDQPLSGYTNFGPPAKVNNLDLDFYQSKELFLFDNPLQYTFLTPWTGDAATVAFTTTVSKAPIYPGTLTVSDNTELFEDTNKTWTASDVTITGSAGGSLTVNYSTGAVSAAFAAAPATGQTIYLNYVGFTAGRPQAILMYDNKFRLWPVPDQQYLVKMQSYQVVTALTLATDTPQLDEWGPCIAYGTARDILSDYGEMDAYQEVTALYKEQVSYILTRTMQNMMEGRASPSF